jgi:hypothetical protein
MTTSTDRVDYIAQMAFTLAGLFHLSLANPSHTNHDPPVYHIITLRGRLKCHLSGCS